MINEIKRMLNTGIKFSLECIDPAGFELENFLNKAILKLDSIEPIKWQGGSFSLTEGIFIKPDDEYERRIHNNPFIAASELKYFKIKEIEKMMGENKAVDQEVKEPTFDDLIDSAVKAVRDGELHKFTFNKCLSSKDIIWLYTYKDESKHFTHDQSQSGIDFINSLYTERFVIDKECLMPKVKNEAKVTLSNGNSFIARKVEHSFVVMKDGSEIKSLMFKDGNDFWVTYSFFELKGATVTQQKGNK